jgi:Cysteine-rich secretory protein family
MARVQLLASALGLMLTGPAFAGDPFTPLPPVQHSDAELRALRERSPGATGELALRLLAAHNRERAAVGHAPLAWDADLAASAASYGPALASLRHLIHSPRETRPGQRENLAMAWHGTLSPEQLVDMWSREKRMLQPGVFPAVSNTGRWEDVAN